MKKLSTFLTESKEKHHDAAKIGFDHIVDSTKAAGAHKGSARVYYNHTGGQIKNTFVGDHDHFSYASPSRYTGPGHYFAHHYSSGPGHNVYTHVKLKRNHDLSDVNATEKEIEKQNPHLEKGSGHARNLAMDIVKAHGRKES